MQLFIFEYIVVWYCIHSLCLEKTCQLSCVNTPLIIVIHFNSTKIYTHCTMIMNEEHIDCIACVNADLLYKELCETKQHHYLSKEVVDRWNICAVTEENKE